MTLEEFALAFEEFSEAVTLCEFELVEPKRSQRKDLHAFLLLEGLTRGQCQPMVSCATHDLIWLGVSVEDVAAAITREQVQELVRCGVHYDESVDSLSMNV